MTAFDAAALTAIVAMVAAYLLWEFLTGDLDD